MTKEPRWIQVAHANQVPVREGRAVQIEGTELAIFNLGDRFLAVENRCPHRGGPLADGIVSGSEVVCPLHAWKVCLEDGSVVKPAGEQACLKSYRTCVEDGVVSVEIPAREGCGAGAGISATAIADAGEASESSELGSKTLAG
jgi:nitrite reductase (NADH) small subunit